MIDRSGGIEDRLQVEPAALAVVVARAFAERPGLGVDAPTLGAHVERVAGEEDPVALHAGDLLLACACLQGDSAALEALEREHITRVPSYISRVTTDRPVVEEVQQLVRHRLLLGNEPRLAAYGGRGPLVAWLRVLATRVALNLVQKREDAADERALEEAALGDDLELMHIKALYHDQVKESFSGALAALDPGDRTLLRFSLLDGLTVDEMAVASRSHRTTVMRNLARVRERLISDVRRRLVAQLRCDHDEAEELIELVRSRLELSLSRLL